jgi:hypothetical protein
MDIIKFWFVKIVKVSRMLILLININEADFLNSIKAKKRTQAKKIWTCFFTEGKLR